MISSQTPPPFGSAIWTPEILNFAIAELRREFPAHRPERIVHAVDFAARLVRPDAGKVRLLQKSRETLREAPLD